MLKWYSVHTWRASDVSMRQPVCVVVREQPYESCTHSHTIFVMPVISFNSFPLLLSLTHALARVHTHTHEHTPRTRTRTHIHVAGKIVGPSEKDVDLGVLDGLFWIGWDAPPDSCKSCYNAWFPRVC